MSPLAQSLAAAITIVVLCAGLTPAVVGAQTPQPTPPGPYTSGECGELAPAPDPAFAAPTDLAVRWGPLPDNPQFSGALLSWRDNADNEACYIAERKGPEATVHGLPPGAPPPGRPTLPAAVSPTAVAQPTALPAAGGGPSDDGMPFNLLTGSLLAGAVLTLAGLLIPALRRR